MLHLVSHGEPVFHIFSRFFKSILNVAYHLGRQVQVWDSNTIVYILSCPYIASFSVYASWQFLHEYLQNILTDNTPTVFSSSALHKNSFFELYGKVNCCKNVFSVRPQNTVERIGDEEQRDKVWDCADVNMYRRVWKFSNVDKMHVFTSAFLQHPLPQSIPTESQNG